MPANTEIRHSGQHQRPQVAPVGLFLYFQHSRTKERLLHGNPDIPWDNQSQDE